MANRFPLWGQAGWASAEVVGETHYAKAIRALFGNEFNPQGTEIDVPVQLIPDRSNKHDRNAVGVWSGTSLLGHLPRPEAARYVQVLTNLTTRGMVPEVNARIHGREWGEYEGRPPAFVGTIRLDLAEPHMLVPANSPPAQEHRVLPTGSAVQVLGQAQFLDALRPLLRREGECWAYVTLHEMADHLIEVRVGEARVGDLSPKMSAELLPALRHLAEQGLVTAARAVVKGLDGKAEVMLYMARAHDLPDSWQGLAARQAAAASVSPAGPTTPGRAPASFPHPAVATTGPATTPGGAAPGPAGLPSRPDPAATPSAPAWTAPSEPAWTAPGEPARTATSSEPAWTAPSEAAWTAPGEPARTATSSEPGWAAAPGEHAWAAANESAPARAAANESAPAWGPSNEPGSGRAASNEPAPGAPVWAAPNEPVPSWAATHAESAPAWTAPGESPGMPDWAVPSGGVPSWATSSAGTGLPTMPSTGSLPGGSAPHLDLPVVSTGSASRLDPPVAAGSASRLDPPVAAGSASRLDPPVAAGSASRLDPPVVSTGAIPRVDPTTGSMPRPDSGASVSWMDPVGSVAVTEPVSSVSVPRPAHAALSRTSYSSSSVSGSPANSHSGSSYSGSSAVSGALPVLDPSALPVSPAPDGGEAVIAETTVIPALTAVVKGNAGRRTGVAPVSPAADGNPHPPIPSAPTGIKFAVPPGWPVPPAGWYPPAGWRPDPSWPLAPAGWQWWVPTWE
ncbi:hypothetical protein OHA21_24185 [Actinoplanes sp. NBC_00393]|uniref:hypothetical protein n=1 Tax=Actinoplanes sp. NBC_00393 TaxID=2975953 RepID=UPI002E1AC3A0